MSKIIGIKLLERMRYSSVVTCKEFTDELKISASIVRKEIHALNEELSADIAQIKMKRGHGNGYSLEVIDATKFEKFLRNYLQEIRAESLLMNSPIQRVEKIALTLLNSENPIKLEDLAKELFVSTRQLNNDLRMVRSYFDDYLLNIVNRPYYGMHVEGSEFNRRLCMSNLYFKNLFVGGFDQRRMIINAEIDKQFNEIKQLILQESSQLHFQFSDISLDNLAIHLFVMMKRATVHKKVPVSDSLKIMKKNEQEIMLAKNILVQLEDKFHVSFSEFDYQYLGIHIAGKRAYLTDEISLIPQEAKELTEEILLTLDNSYNTNFLHDEQLRIRLCLHMAPLLIRIQNKIVSKNPMVEEIKSRYALSNEMAVVAGQIINQRYHVQITQDELSYIALHLELSSYQTEFKQYSILLICHTGQWSSEILKQQILSNFEHYIYRIDTCSVNRVLQMDLDRYTFILSTIPIRLFTKTPVYEIGNFLDGNNVKKISSLFKLGDFTENSLRKYFPKELFIAHLDAKSREEAILRMVEIIKKYQDVPENFYDEIIERERLSSTDYGNQVAIPHPMTPSSDFTFTCVGVLKEPIQWGNNMVSVIFLNSIGKTREDLQPYYYLVTQFITDADKVSRFLKKTTYEHLIILMNKIEK